MPEAVNASDSTSFEQYASPAFSSIRTSVPPILQRPAIYVEPTPLYAQKNGPTFPDKFFDRCPVVPAAGYLPGPESEDMGKIIRGNEEAPRPPQIKKFHDYYFTEAADRRIHYGQVSDPERKIAAERVHGLTTKQSDTSKDLLNPQPKSLVDFHLERLKESAVYASKKHPLGAVPKPNLPSNLDLSQATFGHTNDRSEKGGDVINPRKSTLQVEWEGEQCKDLYRLSHLAFDPAEQKHRDYPYFNSNKMYGMPTPNDPRGGRTKKALDWITDCLERQGARVESERLVNYRERFSHQLGKVRDPILDTMAVDPLCHAFGLPSKPDPYKAGDLIHQRTPKEWLQNHWNRRNAVISEVRRQLKKHLWTSFEQFINICLNRDKTFSGTLPTEEIRSIFKTMLVPLEPEVLEQLLDLCDVGVCNDSGETCGLTSGESSTTGQINYKQLVCILNWTDRTVGDAKTTACSKHNSEDSENIRKLEKKIDECVSDYRKSSSVYGAVQDVPTSNLRHFGVPSRRADLPVPRIRKLDDRQNYGDEPGVVSLIRPSIMTRHGITERDVFMPRTRTEIKTILVHIGVDMSENDFEAIWDRAQLVQMNGGRSTVRSATSTMSRDRETLSLEAFRVVLDEIMARRAANGQLNV